MNEHLRDVAHRPLAIVGMACRLPGADNLDEYWQQLVTGQSGLGELPPERFDRRLYFDPRKGQRTKSYTTLGGVVQHRPFDRTSCPLPESLIEQSHEVHLALCEVAADACRHAGMDPFQLPKRNVGVYVGHTPPNGLSGKQLFARRIAETAQYLREVAGFDELAGGDQEAVIREIIEIVRREHPPDDPSLRIRANAHHAAALISRGFGLDGPSMAFDAACASAMRAFGHAVRALQLNQIDMAIVGAASLCHSDTLILFSQAQSVSASGSRPFDQNADGLVAAEGFLILVLKTLDEAMANGDRVLSVVRGVGISSDGKGKSLWAPRKEGQVEAIRRAYGPGIAVEDLQFIEMHATSTQVGDATEMSALEEVLARRLPPGVKIPVGSAKANVGHTLESAGLVSLVKTVLAMQHGMIPPQINVQTPNDKIGWDRLPFYVPQTAERWDPPAPGKPRRAAVNAFGIGGLNVHVVLDDSVHDAAAASNRIAAPAAQANGHSTRPAATPAAPTAQAAPNMADEPIAIIGSGAVFPGAHTIDALWDVVRSGTDQRKSIPPEPWMQYVDLEGPIEKSYRAPICQAGFITDYEYDWKKHRVPPKHIAAADPLQFMLLDAADQALRDAGYHEKPFDKTRTGTIVGTVFGGDFTDQITMGLRLEDFKDTLRQVLEPRGVAADDIQRVAGEYENILLRYMPALIDETGSFTSSTVASRITKTFDLMGGAVAVDAGGASSMAALNACIDLLRTGDCDMMLCGAGQRVMSCATYACMAEDGRLVSGEAAGPFDANSGGVPGECVGVLILKRLSDARRDGDNIRGVIRGMGVARDDSLDASLRRAIERALQSARVDPSEVALVEAAATGSPVQDEAELQALTAAYGNREEPLMLSAAGGQFGYTGGASGMASVLKAVGELGDVTVPPAAGIKQPAPLLNGRQNLLKLPMQPSPLPALNEDGRVLAGIDSVSEYNLAYHMLLEGPVALPKTAAPRVDVAQVAAAHTNGANGVRMEEYNGLNVLQLAGSPLEMGRQQGQAQAEEIKRVLRRYADQVGTRWERVLNVDEAAARPEMFFGPQELEELEGIALGADVSVESVIAHNLRLYLDSGSGGIHFAYTARSNPAQGLVHATNEDLQRGLSVLDCLARNIQVRRPAGAIAHVVFGVAGQVGCLNGLNAAGVAVSTTALLDTRHTESHPDGVLHTVLVKQLLERATNLDSALDMIRQAPGRGTWSLCLSHHPSDSLCYMEFDGRQLKVHPSPPAIAASNHRLLDAAGTSQAPPHSLRRLERLQSLLNGPMSQGITSDMARTILRDRFDPSRRRKLEAPTLNTVRRVDNQISIVMQPAQGHLWVTSGPLANGHQNEFWHLNLSELLAPAQS